MTIQPGRRIEAGASGGTCSNAIEFRIPSDPRSAGLVRDGICGFARSHGISEEDVAAFITALGEALANAIEHARAHRPIEILCRLEQDCIVATVQDNGVGFDDSWVRPQTFTLPGAQAERGRGLPIMRRLSDIFEVRSTPGVGTAVVVGRRLAR